MSLPYGNPAPESGGSGGSNVEIVELQVISKTPTPENLKGLNDVVAKLKEMQEEVAAVQDGIAGIKSPTRPAPQTAQTSAQANANERLAKDASEAQAMANAVSQSTEQEGAAHARAAAEIEAQAAATRDLAAAQRQLISRQTTTPFTGDVAGQRRTTLKEQLGPGKTLTTVEPGANRTETLREDFVAKEREEFKAQKQAADTEIARLRKETDARISEAKRSGRPSEIATAQVNKQQEFARLFDKLARETSSPLLAEQYKAKAESSMVEAFNSVSRGNREIVGKRISDVRNQFAKSIEDAVASGDKTRVSAARQKLSQALSSEYAELAKVSTDAGLKSQLQLFSGGHAEDAAKHGASIRAEQDRQVNAQIEADRKASEVRASAHAKAQAEREKERARLEKEAADGEASRKRDRERQDKASRDAFSEQADQSKKSEGASRKAESDSTNRQTAQEVSGFGVDQKAQGEEAKRAAAELNRIAEARRLVDQAVREQEQFIRTQNDFQTRIAQLEAEGFKRTDIRQRRTLDGLVQQEEKWEKISKGRKRVAKLQSAFEPNTGFTPSGVDGVPPTPGPRFVAGSLTETEGNAPVGRGATGLLRGFDPKGFVTNLAHVTAWAAAVGVLYKGLGLVEFSLTRVIEIGGQTARLGQVFRGVGGNAQQLTDDVLALAAANGRSSSEAIEAAIAWSRLGLSRVQVNEAVRVSLIAANVAEVDAGQATKYLSSIMSVYQLNVSQLNTVLGLLNQTSNTYNVTNKDLFEGISRSAAIAKQAGVSLAELQGLIGATVGRTGQTGANVGNLLKTVISKVGREDVQESLRTSVGIEVITKGGDLRDFSGILEEIFVKYQKLNGEERASLVNRIAGATQATRFVALLQSYVQGQVLATQSQLNLNSAEQENEKITGSVKSQLIGLRTEYERLAVKLANQPVIGFGGSSSLQLLADITKGIKNVIAVYGTLADLAGEGRKFLFGSPKPQGIGSLNTFNTLAQKFTDFASGVPTAQFDALTKQVNDASTQASGFSNKSRTLTTVLKVIKGSDSVEEKTGLAKTVAPLISDDEKKQKQFTELVSTGNITEAEKQIKAVAEEAEKQSKEQKEISIATATAEVKLYDERIAALKTEHAEQSKINELESERGDLIHKNTQLIIESSDLDPESEAFHERQQKIATLLAVQKGYVADIARIYAQIPGDAPVQRVDRVAVLKAEEAELTKLVYAYESLTGPGADEARKKAEEKRREVRSEIAYNESPDAKSFDTQVQRREATLAFGKNLVERGGVGANEAERLINTQRAVEQIIASRDKLKDLDGKALSEQDRTLITLNAIAESKNLDLKRAELLVKLEVERTNLIKEQQREFAKSLLLAGPADLLRKFAVAQQIQKSGGRLSAGQFFSLSPEARGDAQAASAFLNPRIQEVDREIKLLQPGQLTLQQTKAKFEKNDQIALQMVNVGPLDESFMALKRASDLLSNTFKRMVARVTFDAPTKPTTQGSAPLGEPVRDSSPLDLNTGTLTPTEAGKSPSPPVSVPQTPAVSVPETPSETEKQGERPAASVEPKDWEGGSGVFGKPLLSRAWNWVNTPVQRLLPEGTFGKLPFEDSKEHPTLAGLVGRLRKQDEEASTPLGLGLLGLGGARGIAESLSGVRIKGVGGAVPPVIPTPKIGNSGRFSSIGKELEGPKPPLLEDYNRPIEESLSQPLFPEAQPPTAGETVAETSPKQPIKASEPSAELKRPTSDELQSASDNWRSKRAALENEPKGSGNWQRINDEEDAAGAEYTRLSQAYFKNGAAGAAAIIPTVGAASTQAAPGEKYPAPPQRPFSWATDAAVRKPEPSPEPAPIAAPVPQRVGIPGRIGKTTRVLDFSQPEPRETRPDDEDGKRELSFYQQVLNTYEELRKARQGYTPGDDSGRWITGSFKKPEAPAAPPPIDSRQTQPTVATDAVTKHWRQRLAAAQALPDSDKDKQQSVDNATSALRDWEHKGQPATSDRVRSHWEGRIKEAQAIPDIGLRDQAVKAAESALTDFIARQKGGASTTDRVRAHWAARLKEAMDMSKSNPGLRQAAIDAANQAGSDFERKLKGDSGTNDRVREHWKQRLKEAQAMDDKDPDKARSVDEAENALSTYNTRRASTVQAMGQPKFLSSSANDHTSNLISQSAVAAASSITVLQSGAGMAADALARIPEVVNSLVNARLAGMSSDSGNVASGRAQHPIDFSGFGSRSAYEGAP